VKYAFGRKFIKVYVCQNYQNIAWFDKVLQKIKWCGFFSLAWYINAFISSQHLKLTKTLIKITKCFNYIKVLVMNFKRIALQFYKTVWSTKLHVV